MSRSLEGGGSSKNTIGLPSSTSELTSLPRQLKIKATFTRLWYILVFVLTP